MDQPNSTPRILLLDIETAPASVYTFSLFKPIIGIDQIITPPRIICWSAKWLDTKGVLFDSEFHSDYDTMIRGIFDLINDADVIVTYNGQSFDEPWLQGEFIAAGLGRPKPVRHVDLYRISRKNMRLISGKLDFLSLTLLGERKTTHEGFQLWRKCVEKDHPEHAKAWAKMKKYSLKDTALMEPLYKLLSPFITEVNWGLYTGEQFVCPVCGTSDLQKRGFKVTGASVFQRYRCVNGHWPADSKRIATTTLRSS